MDEFTIKTAIYKQPEQNVEPLEFGNEDERLPIGEERMLFHNSISMSFAQWSYVEDALFMNATACVPRDQWPLMAVGFWSIENFRSKQSFVDKIVTEKFGKTSKYDGWDKLMDRLRTLSTQRNKIAHRAAVEFPADLNLPGRRIALVNWITYERMNWEGTYKRKPPPDSLCVVDIDHIKARFGAMFSSLHNRSRVLLGEQAQIPESLAQEPDLPTLREIRLHFREELARPPHTSQA